MIFVLAWRAPDALFERLSNLRAVCSLGAGVDELVADPSLPGRVALGRVAGPRLAADMAAYLLAVATSHWRDLPALQNAQRQAAWQPPTPAATAVVGLLGVGTLGGRAAEAFRAIGWPVVGWSRSGRGPLGVTMYRGRRGLARIAAESDFLINLLPLTASTRNLLDGWLFAHMRRGSVLVNVGRGEHLVESDLLEALARQRPAHAVLDVFRQEPLARDHPFWAHPQIRVTPHCAAVTRDEEAAEIAAESYRRVAQGRPPLGAVDRKRQY